MNFENMSNDELKQYAKDNGIRVGNTSRDKLIAKLNEAEQINSVMTVEDDDFIAPVEVEEVQAPADSKSLIESIEDTINDLEDSEQEIFDTSFTPLPPDSVVNVKSITFGGLIYKSAKTGAVIKWNKIGAVQQMTIAEITEMNNNSPIFLNKPNIILLNETAMKQFRLTKKYEEVAKISDLKGLFKKDINEIERVIRNALEVNMRDLIIAKIRTMYANKTLTDINIINMLEEVLQFDLTR